MRQLISVFAILIIFLQSCLSFEVPEYEKMANKINFEAAKALMSRHPISLMGFGGGMMDQINLISIRFHVDHPLTKEEARVIIVDCIDEFLSRINNNEEIRPYLAEYPFPLKRYSIAIFSSHEDGNTVYYPLICVVSTMGDQIAYFTNDEQNKPKYKTEEYETLEEAKAILK